MMLKRTIILSLIYSAPFLASAQKQFDKQAHRGGAGLMPENTIAAAKNALRLGNTIEMDLYMSKDSQIVVTHDPHIVAAYSLHPNHTQVLPEEEENMVIKNLDYEEIKRIEIGLRPYPVFPDQKKIHANIPRFADLIDSAEAFAMANHLPPPEYNIQPGPAYTITDEFRADFIKKMMHIIITRKIQKRSMIQAFDMGMLEETHRKYPEMIISMLVGKEEIDLETSLKKLSFKPGVYSPYYSVVSQEMVSTCHKLGIKVIPWTVDNKEEIEKLKALGVDGIISNYPDRL